MHVWVWLALVFNLQHERIAHAAHAAQHVLCVRRSLESYLQNAWRALRISAMLLALYRSGNVPCLPTQYKCKLCALSEAPTNYLG